MKSRTPQDFYIPLGQNIRAARVKCGLSQENLSDELGVSFQQLQKYESGFNRIPLHHLVTISRITAVSITEFIGAKKIKEFPIKEKREIILMRKMLSMPEPYFIIAEKMVNELAKLD